MLRRIREEKLKKSLRSKIYIDFFEHLMYIYITVIRACTGFDGALEIWEAIRVGTRHQLNLKLNAEDNFALAA